MRLSSFRDWLEIADIIVPVLVVFYIMRADRLQEDWDQQRLARIGETSRFERPWYELTARRLGFPFIGIGLLFLVLRVVPR